jgi:hypothetical protein
MLTIQTVLPEAVTKKAFHRQKEFPGFPLFSETVYC